MKFAREGQERGEGKHGCPVHGACFQLQNTEQGRGSCWMSDHRVKEFRCSQDTQLLWTAHSTNAGRDGILWATGRILQEVMLSRDFHSSATCWESNKPRNKRLLSIPVNETVPDGACSSALMHCHSYWSAGTFPDMVLPLDTCHCPKRLPKHCLELAESSSQIPWAGYGLPV